MNQIAILIFNEIFTIELSADVYNIKPVIFYYLLLKSRPSSYDCDDSLSVISKSVR